MTINYTLMKTAIDTAKEILSQQTADDLRLLTDHFGKAYDESKIVAEIAVKLILRIGKIPTSTDIRQLTPVDGLVFQAETLYSERFGA